MANNQISTNVVRTITKGVGKVKVDPTMILQGLQEVVTAHNNYKIVAEQEKTKREYIKADKECCITRINAQRDIMLRALDNSFAERKHNFKELFERLDRAIESDNNEHATQILCGIVDLAKTTPFSEIQKTISDFNNDSVASIEI